MVFESITPTLVLKVNVHGRLPSALAAKSGVATIPPAPHVDPLLPCWPQTNYGPGDSERSRPNEGTCELRCLCFGDSTTSALMPGRTFPLRPQDTRGSSVSSPEPHVVPHTISRLSAREIGDNQSR